MFNVPEVIIAAAETAVAVENGMTMFSKDKKPVEIPISAAVGISGTEFLTGAIIIASAVILLAAAMLAHAAIVHHGLALAA